MKIEENGVRSIQHKNSFKKVLTFPGGTDIIGLVALTGFLFMPFLGRCQYIQPLFFGSGLQIISGGKHYDYYAQGSGNQPQVVYHRRMRTVLSAGPLLPLPPSCAASTRLTSLPMWTAATM